MRRLIGLGLLLLGGTQAMADMKTLRGGKVERDVTPHRVSFIVDHVKVELTQEFMERPSAQGLWRDRDAAPAPQKPDAKVTIRFYTNASSYPVPYLPDGTALEDEVMWTQEWACHSFRQSDIEEMATQLLIALEWLRAQQADQSEAIPKNATRAILNDKGELVGWEWGDLILQHDSP